LIQKKAREKLAQSKTNEKVSYESGSRIPYLGGFLTLQTAQADRRLVPEWIDVNLENLQGTVKELPTSEMIDVPVDEMLIVELYSK